MEFKRDYYLNQLISSQNNGLIKIVTGIRRCGKSYLLNRLLCNYLTKNGVDQAHIVKVALDSIENRALREPLSLWMFVSSDLLLPPMFRICYMLVMAKVVGLIKITINFRFAIYNRVKKFYGINSQKYTNIIFDDIIYN